MLATRVGDHIKMQIKRQTASPKDNNRDGARKEYVTNEYALEDGGG